MKHTFYKSATSKNPVSAAVKAGDTLYISGQLAIDPATGKMVSDDAGEQTVQVLKNIQSVAANAGFSMDDIVKTTVYAANREDMPAINAAYAKAWGEDKPARLAILSQFPNPAVKVEIEAIAVKQ